MNVDAYLFSGRMVASAYRKPSIIKNHKAKAYLWYDTKECGGIYERLEEWMANVRLCHANETVSFRVRD